MMLSRVMYRSSGLSSVAVNTVAVNAVTVNTVAVNTVAANAVIVSTAMLVWQLFVQSNVAGLLSSTLTGTGDWPAL
jgi:hypothetical protein